jgi:7,8-dihydropterin-6-yl-methyl-4-(beta-D-ribofuranosyl)aminobenzene 5'-phosphate synthase
LEDGSPDFVIDDSALSLILPEGKFVITGCGHAGILDPDGIIKFLSIKKKLKG